MPIQMKCKGCQKVLKVPDAVAGKRIKCPACQTILAVPAPKAAAPKPAKAKKASASNPYQTDSAPGDSSADMIGFQDEIDEAPSPFARPGSIPPETKFSFNTSGFEEEDPKTRSLGIADAGSGSGGGIPPQAIKIGAIAVGVIVVGIIGMQFMGGSKPQAPDVTQAPVVQQPTSTLPTTSGLPEFGDDDAGTEGSDVVAINVTKKTPKKTPEKTPEKQPDKQPEPKEPTPEELEAQRLAAEAKLRQERMTQFSKALQLSPAGLFESPSTELDYQALALEALADLSGKSQGLQPGAAQYISYFQRAEDLPLLFALLDSNAPQTVKIGVYGALGNYDLPEVRERLYFDFNAVLNAGDNILAAEALRSYCRHGSPDKLPELINAFDRLSAVVSRAELFDLLRQIDFDKSQELHIANMVATGKYNSSLFRELYDIGDNRAIGGLVDIIKDMKDVREFKTIDGVLTELTYDDPLDLAAVPSDKQAQALAAKIDMRRSWYRSNRSNNVHEWAERAADSLQKRYVEARVNVENIEKRLERLYDKSQKNYDEIQRLNGEKGSWSQQQKFALRVMRKSDHPAFASNALGIAQNAPENDPDARQMLKSLTGMTGFPVSGIDFVSQVKYWTGIVRDISGKNPPDQALLAATDNNPLGQKYARTKLPGWTQFSVSGAYAKVFPGESDLARWRYVVDLVGRQSFEGYIRASIEMDLSILSEENKYLGPEATDAERVAFRTDVIKHLRSVAHRYFDYRPDHPKALRDAAIGRWMEWWGKNKRSFSWS